MVPVLLGSFWSGTLPGVDRQQEKASKLEGYFLQRNVGEEKLYKCPKELGKLLTSEVAVLGCLHRFSDLRSRHTLALFGAM